jgi:hypothetical protein
MTNPIFNVTPLLTMVSVTIRVLLDGSADTSRRMVALVCGHFLLSQVRQGQATQSRLEGVCAVRRAASQQNVLMSASL